MIYNLYFEANKQAHIVKLGEHEETCVQYLTINTASRDELMTIEKSILLVSTEPFIPVRILVDGNKNKRMLYR